MNENIRRFVSQIGLLNVPLFHSQDLALEKYALLNGSSSNLCIDAEPFSRESDYRGYAWSAGNNNYVLFDQEQCRLFRSDKPSVENYPIQLILEHAEDFFEYLAKHNKNVESHVVPYVLRTYRELRNEIRTAYSGIDSLKCLLYLLAYHNDDGHVDLGKWGLDQSDKDITENINHTKWEMIYDRFREGVFIQNHRLKPRIDLILRHTAGKLFEEANYIAYLPNQMSLFPEDKIRYSSKTSQDGAYFTPAYVARSIVEESLRNLNLEDKQQITIFDPACGASGFLVEALRQLKKAGFNKPVKVIAWDKAETAIKMSKFLLSFEKQEWGDLLDIEDIRICDSLQPENEWPRNVDLLLMNPPFLAWDKFEDQELKNIINRMYPIKGKPNLSAVFLIKAIASVGYDGVLGAVLPSTLLNDQTNEWVRKEILNNMSLKIIGGLGSYVFETVQTYVSMIVSQKNRAYYDSTTMLWTNNIKGAAEKGLRALRKFKNSNLYNSDKSYSIYLHRITSDMSSWRVENGDNLALKSKLEEAIIRGEFCRVRDIFEVKLGVRTGSNKVFVINEDVYTELPDEEKKYFRPVVDNITLDWGHLYPYRYIFYPYSKDLKIADENQLREIMPSIYEKILEPNKNALRNRNTVKDKSKWWILSEHRVWQEGKVVKLVSTEFGHSGSFAIDYTGEYVVERGNMWAFNVPGFKPTLKYYEAYLAVFNSNYWNNVLRIYGSQLSGGDVYKLGMTYVGNIPIPDLSNQMYESFIPRLRSFATKMKNEEYWDDEELNALVDEIVNYGE